MAKRHLLIWILLAPAAVAQPPVAPTPAQVGATRGDNSGDYNITNSFETGYRFSLIDGNAGKYRSDVNYGNGIRLLGSSLNIHSRDGHGRLFDELVLTTSGLGNDPYQSAILRVQKNHLYEYDMRWRLVDYFNPGLTVASGLHAMDTTRRVQDHDLTLFPQSRLQVRFGYSRNDQTGPALSTLQVYGSGGDAFPLFTDVRRVMNDYRLGADFQVGGAKLSVTHFWEDYKEDNPFTLAGVTSSGVVGDPTTLTQFRRNEPYHGTSPGWLVNLFRGRKMWAINGRFTYIGGTRDFILDETALGVDRFGANRNRQVVVGGSARRPVATGDFSFSVFPGTRLTVVNNTSVHNTRIDGDATYQELNLATLTSNLFNFRYLGIRVITNSTDANYRVSKWLAFYGGYHYSTRRIQLKEAFATPPGSELDSTLYEQNNHLHTGLAGIRFKPVKPLSISLDGEIGRSDQPLSPVVDRDYHALGARAEYRLKTLTLSTAYKQNYNNNSVTLSTFSSRARNYNADASWSPRDWFSLDASYSKLHLDTVGGLAFFAGLGRPQLVEGLNSIYVSNIHAGTLMARVAIRKRVDLYAGYSITKDVGDGRSSAIPASITDPVQQLLASAQTFPLTFHSPQARVSVQLSPKVRWNAGWQFYRYREQFGLFSFDQNYRAHTGYTSILWSF
ncbi:MAG TPA: hypothetical protein VG672_26870 [Bryobacteraceae bacterium]|nr:hypothetical protein [Bryobacteraceae bacterium]